MKQSEMLPTPNNLYKPVLQIMQNWHKPNAWTDSPLSQLRIVSTDTSTQMMNERTDLHQLIDSCLQQLKQTYPDYADVLSRRFIDGEMTREIAQSLNMSPDSVNRVQKKAIVQLAHIMLTHEQRARQENAHAREAQLPVSSYKTLIGHSDTIQMMFGWLQDSAGPEAIFISGLGGIGKTAVADALVRTFIQHQPNSGVLWVYLGSPSMSGRAGSPEWAWAQIINELSEVLSLSDSSQTVESRAIQIKNRLRQVAYLLIIDNIEDEETANHLAKGVSAWVNPTRCILTSRAHPTPQPGQKNVVLSELSQTDSYALIRQLAQENGLSELNDGDTTALHTIYKTTGGHPLAIKLVVGLAQKLPLPIILSDLNQMQMRPTEDMYRHIYGKMWQTLSPAARSLLEAMPLIGDVGATPAQMQAMSQLDDNVFWQAVNDLATNSLLEVRGSVWDRRYGIHRLTERFLTSEIIHWPQDDTY